MNKSSTLEIIDLNKGDKVSKENMRLPLDSEKQRVRNFFFLGTSSYDLLIMVNDYIILSKSDFSLDGVLLFVH